MDIYLQKAVTSIPFKCTVKPVLRGHLWNKAKVVF